MQKLYCYVDESGQDTEGRFFLTAVVIVTDEHNDVEILLEKIEKESGKGRDKWARTDDKKRLAYIEAVLKASSAIGQLYYAVYANTTKYTFLRAQTTARAIEECTADDYKAVVSVDGLNDKEGQEFTNLLRKQWDIKADKIKPAKDQGNAMIRLADALCGFIRDGLEGKKSFRSVLDKAERERIVIEVKQK